MFFFRIYVYIHGQDNWNIVNNIVKNIVDNIIAE